MPRVSEKEIERSANITRGEADREDSGYWRSLLAKDLQDARAALKAILNWKDRTTDEAPLTYIERVAREVVG